MNYDDVKQAIVEKLEMLRDSPNRDEPPMIYHLDVGAMYPNIILTNRLQPSAMVSQEDCAACEFNRAENNCKRPMSWLWRGDYSPADMAEFNSIRKQLSYERVEGSSFSELTEKQQADRTKARVKSYSQRVYRKTKITTTEERINTVCMRENPVYVNTVRAFRDRRYDYKLLTKTWKGKKIDAEKKGDSIARKQVLLQLLFANVSLLLHIFHVHIFELLFLDVLALHQYYIILYHIWQQAFTLCTACTVRTVHII